MSIQTLIDTNSTNSFCIYQNWFVGIAPPYVYLIMSATRFLMILTHYYHQDDPPFQNLSLLTHEEALSVISSLRNRVGAVYNRFKDPKKYLSQRRETEQWVRQEFIKKGGKPISAYPHYFTLDRAAWIETGYEGQSKQIHFPVSTFQPEQVSFTYPDSMISYWLQSQVKEVFYCSEYHGRVFTLSEIYKVVDKFGIPHEEWQTAKDRKYDLFIEAQVWTSIPSQPTL
jgi:hypothetical protein